MRQEAEDQQQQVTRLFRSSAPKWKEIYERHDLYSVIYQRRRTICLSLIAGIGLPPSSTVLEVGCGPGLTTVSLALEHYLVCAMDIVPDMVAAARRRAIEAGAGQYVSVSIGDVRHLAFREGYFDVVVVVGVTEWIRSLPELLREVSRVTKRGGYVVIASDNARGLHLMLDPLNHPLLAPARRLARALLATYFHREFTPDTYSYSLAEFDSSMRKAGLVNLQQRSVGFGPFSFFRRKLLPETRALKVDRLLQKWADDGLPLLRSAGHVFVMLARKVELTEQSPSAG